MFNPLAAFSLSDHSPDLLQDDSDCSSCNSYKFGDDLTIDTESTYTYSQYEASVTDDLSSPSSSVSVCNSERRCESCPEFSNPSDLPCSQLAQNAVYLAEMFGETHPMVIQTWTILGGKHFAAGDMNSALDAFGQALKVCAYGPQMISCYHNVGRTLFAMKEFNESIKVFRRVVDLSRCLICEDLTHYDVALVDSKLKLGLSLRATGRFQASRDMLRDAEELLKFAVVPQSLRDEIATTQAATKPWLVAGRA